MVSSVSIHYKTHEIAAQIDSALADGRPYVLTRMGDGESSFLYYLKGIPMTERVGGAAELWNHYGISAGRRDIEQAIVEAIPQCDAFGVPFLEPYASLFNMRPRIEEAFRYWGWDLATWPLCTHYVSRFLLMCGHFAQWTDLRLIVVNADAEEIGEHLRRDEYAPGAEPFGLGPMNIVGTVPIGRDEVDEVVERALAYEFDIALVGAGVRKYPICWRLADKAGAVVLDMGHALNSLVTVHPSNRQYQSATYEFDWRDAKAIVRSRPDDI